MNEFGVLFYKCEICWSVTSQPLTFTMEDSMAKKESEKPEVVQTVWDLNSLVCQCCRYHDNKPHSYCAHKDTYVGRKEEACDHFKKGRNPL